MILPGFEWRDIGQPSGKTYDMHTNPKLCWHTWESYSWSGAEAAFAPYPPHVAVNPRDRRRCQYVSLDRAAYALTGSDTEDSWVIQVEVAGYAGESHDWPPEDLQWLGEAVLAPIAAAVPVPPVVCSQGFHGEGEGIVLASPSSPIRFTLNAWDNFAGHVGHQHAPAPDEHWDPGRLDVSAIIAATGEEEDMSYTDADRRRDEIAADSTPTGPVIVFDGNLQWFEVDRHGALIQWVYWQADGRWGDIQIADIGTCKVGAEPRAVIYDVYGTKQLNVFTPGGDGNTVHCWWDGRAWGVERFTR